MSTEERADRVGLLLVNLGSPSAPTSAALRTYLREFLGDPRVIDLPMIARRPLVDLVIAPTRAPKSAAAYAKIWRQDGSPLLAHSRDLREAVAKLWHEGPVELGMRYGEPAMVDALARLIEQGCSRVVLVPLYPQYATSSTGTVLARAYEAASRSWNTPFLTVVPPFFDRPEYTASLAAVTAESIEVGRPDHLLISFHGLPERHIRKSSPQGTCLRDGCCDRMTDANRNCYRAQCQSTASTLLQRLKWPTEKSSVSFQSRLGRDPWIKPNTEEELDRLARLGVRRLGVVCPSFVADCLETLEEIGIRARAQFLAAGGEELTLVPCLNARPDWTEALVSIARASR